MALSQIPFLALLLSLYWPLAFAKRCVHHHIYSNDTYVSCDTGCCYSYIYPCCDRRFFTTDVFRIAISIVAVCCVLSFILVLLRWRRRRVARLHQAIPVPARGSQNTQQIPAVYGSSTTNYGYNAYPNPSPWSSAYNYNSSIAPTIPPANVMAAPPAYSNLPPPAYQEEHLTHNKTGNQ